MSSPARKNKKKYSKKNYPYQPTTAEAMKAMDVLSKYCLYQGFDKKLYDLSQIEK